MTAYSDGDDVKIVRGTYAGKPGDGSKGEVVSFRVKRKDGTTGTYDGSSIEPWVEAPTPGAASIKIKLSGDKKGGVRDGELPTGGTRVKWARTPADSPDGAEYETLAKDAVFAGTAEKPWVNAVAVNASGESVGNWADTAGDRLKTTQAAPTTPPPTTPPTTPPTSGRFRYGVVLRNWIDNDKAALNTLKANGTNSPLRMEMGLDLVGRGVPLDTYLKVSESYGCEGFPLLMCDGSESDAGIDSLIQRLIGFKGRIKMVEWGNENSMRHISGDSGSASYQAKARRIGASGLRLAAGLAPHGIGVLLEWEAGGMGDQWFENVIAGMGGQANLKKFMGGVNHPYGPNGANKVRHCVAQAVRYGHPEFPLYCTENGYAFDPGKTLTDNYGFPTNSSDTEAVRLFKAQNDEIIAIPTVKAMTYFQTTDQKPPGDSNDREHHFGATRNDGSRKGVFTDYVAGRMAANG